MSKIIFFLLQKCIDHNPLFLNETSTSDVYREQFLIFSAKLATLYDSRKLVIIINNFF